MDKNNTFINDISMYLNAKLDKQILLPEESHINSANDKKVSTNFFKTFIKQTLQRSPGTLYAQHIENKIKDIYAEDYALIDKIFKND